MSSDTAGATALFVDTGAFFAMFKEDDDDHERAAAIFHGIRDESIPYRPIYTSRYVLSELATLMLRKTSHEDAIEALRRAADSPNVTVLDIGETLFAEARSEFERYNDHQISFVDHTSAVLARKHDISYIFAFDSDFTKLGFTRVPDDTGVGR